MRLQVQASWNLIHLAAGSSHEAASTLRGTMRGQALRVKHGQDVAERLARSLENHHTQRTHRLSARS